MLNYIFFFNMDATNKYIAKNKGDIELKNQYFGKASLPIGVSLMLWHKNWVNNMWFSKSI